jgi:flagellar hook-associated protein 1 FlgK
MSGLFASLNNSVKGLNAQQAGLETSGRNLANVNNSSYARQRVIYGDRGTVKTTTGPQSLGIEALGVESMRDNLLDKQLCRERGITAQLSTAQSALQKAQASLGQSISSSSDTSSSTSSTSGIAECLSNFFTSFASLSANPSDTGERQTLLQNADILVDRINLTDSRLAQNQTDLSTQVISDVSEVNTLLASIADLNREISQAEINTAGNAADLRDSRQAKLEELGKKINFESRAQPGEAGQVQVYTTDSSGNEVLLVSNALSATLTTDAGATSITATNVPGGGANATLSITRGSMSGAMDVRDNAIKTLRTQIDNLTRQLVTSVNDVYSGGTTGLNFFDPSGTSPSSISRNTAVTTANLEPDQTSGGATGDSTIPRGVAALASTIFSSSGGAAIDGTLSQYYNNSVSDLGQELSGINTRLSDQETIEKLVSTQRDAVSGVSMDEELTDMMKYQRAFQASSRVISMINEMLDTIINKMG